MTYAYANRTVYHGGIKYEPGDVVENHNHAERLIALGYADSEPPAAPKRGGSSPAPIHDESEED